MLADVGKSPKLTSRPTLSCSLNDDTLYSAGMLLGFNRNVSCDEGFGDVDCAGGGERATGVDVFCTEGSKATTGVEEAAGERAEKGALESSMLICS